MTGGGSLEERNEDGVYSNDPGHKRGEGNRSDRNFRATSKSRKSKEIEKKQKRDEKSASFGVFGGAKLAQSETRCQKTSSEAGARGIARPRARAADDLGAQGSGSSAARMHSDAGSKPWCKPHFAT